VISWFKKRPRTEGVTNYLTLNGVTLDPTSKTLDLRLYGIISPPKDQGDANTCWAFSANGAYEASYKIRKGKDINTSEQEVVNCSGVGRANSGGVSFLVFRWMVDSSRNLADATLIPYLATDAVCSELHPNTDYYGVSSALVSPDGNIDKVPTRPQIKEAICEHGAISAAVYAIDRWRHYKGGVLKDKNTYDSAHIPLSNHAILIIGWSEKLQAWLVKNSWGEHWGSPCNETGYTGKDSGYIWVHYGCENIGKKAAWIMAKK
jgi:cathepsin L